MTVADRASADNYLDQIVNALRSNSHWRPRDLLDPWFAFETGNDVQTGAQFLTAGNRPHTFNNPCPWQHWRKLRHEHFWVSAAAEEVLARAERRDRSVQRGRRDDNDKTIRLMVEHSVPLARISKELSDEKLWERGALRDFLLHHFRRGVITKLEDEALNRTVVCGVVLANDMPPDWKRGDDPFARYLAMKPPLKRAVI